MWPAKSRPGWTPESMMATPTRLPVGELASRPSVARRKPAAPSECLAWTASVGVTTASEEIDRTSGLAARPASAVDGTSSARASIEACSRWIRYPPALEAVPHGSPGARQRAYDDMLYTRVRGRSGRKGPVEFLFSALRSSRVREPQETECHDCGDGGERGEAFHAYH